jgi:mono/diheme cytochrome c family protein
MTRRHWPVPLALALLIGILAGCDKKPTAANNGNGSPEPPPDPSGPAVASGPKGLFDQHCAKCHPSGGAADGGPRKGMKGPDLSQIGAEHDAEWIADHVRNPRTHKPQSRMPEFESKLKPEEIRALSEHLAAMK